MTLRDLDSRAIAAQRRMADLSIALRPGIILGLSVAGVVGLVGIVRWDQQLILIGFLAAGVIVALNAVVATVRLWHRRNIDPGALYVDAEDVVRLRGPNAGR